MENRERNNIYIVPFMGGVLCIFTLFSPFIVSFISLNPIYGVATLVFVIPDLICGIIMVKSGFKMRSGKTTWIEERKKLKICSWIVVCFSLGWAILSMLIVGSFIISFEYGFVGGLLIIFGNYFYNRVPEHNFIYGPTVQEVKKFKLSPMKEQQIYANPKFCTKCGLNLEEKTLKFCPNCGTQLTFG